MVGSFCGLQGAVPHHNSSERRFHRYLLPLTPFYTQIRCTLFVIDKGTANREPGSDWTGEELCGEGEGLWAFEAGLFFHTEAVEVEVSGGVFSSFF